MSNQRSRHSFSGNSTRQISWKVRAFAAVLLAGLIMAPGLRPAHADDNKFDIMRLVTTQWIKPYMYISLDTSGSMHMTFDESYNNDQRWYFDDGGDIDGYVSLKDDWTHDWRGVGQGFWLRVGSRRVINEPPTSWTYDGYTWLTGWVDHDYSNNIYHPNSEPALSNGQLIEIVDYPIDGVNGIYMVSQDSLNSGHNSGWYYTKFIKMNIDGSFADSDMDFPLHPGNGNEEDVKPFTFRRVTMTTVPVDLVASGDSDRSRMNNSPRDLLYIDEDLDVTAGDIVRVTGFSDSRNNGTFLIREYVSNGSGYDRFRVSKMTAGGNFPDSEFEFQGVDDWGGTSELLWLDYTPMTHWYFVPATRIATAKNVWGNDITVYEPSAVPEGVDQEGKEYYLFTGGGPTNGAWMEWEDSGDNGFGKTWHNWAASSGAAPAGDPAYTTTQAPSGMVRRFGDVAHLGLIEYSGGCSAFTPEVYLDPGSPTSVVAPIEARFATRSAGGIQPGGSTPTKEAIASGGRAIVTAYNADPQNMCGRTYGVLLMTDGLSNQCNPSDNSWGSCPSNFASYPAGDADALWKTTVSSNDLEIRTWALGISEEVGRCELNYTAYKGRTDASSPNGDAGFSIDDDPYLTDDDSDVYDTTHGDYAFFASSVDELRQALLDIISSMGVGDYATSSPSVANGSGTTLGHIGFLGSSEYPSWEGHLRAFDLTLTPADTGYELWDAGEVLADATTPNNGFARRIYTWDPDNSNEIVAIGPGTTSTLDTICGSCGITDEVVDFILGNDGNIPSGNTVGTARSTQLGSVLNSTPAVMGSPLRYSLNQLHEHSSFESTYGDRHTLVWIGTSDGSVAGFDIVDGAEILRLIPPNMLYKQIQLYDNYADNPVKNPLGQSGLPGDHIYGVANSIRFGDVWDSNAGEYRTVMFISEGPGGNGIHAVDLTHPYPGRTIDGTTYPEDANYGFGITGNPPVQVLWSMTADGAAGTTQLAGLGSETWSIPALGATAAEQWMLQVGTGYHENAGNASNPEVYYLNPITGGPYKGNMAKSTVSLTNDNAPYVPNNAFADAVVWQNDSSSFQADNLVNESVQADLNGHLWSITESSASMSKTALVTLGDGDPLYYPPAVAGFPNYPVEYSMYTFSTGSFYAQNEDISGSNIGTSGNFIPKVFVSVKELSSGTLTTDSIALTDLDDPDATTGNTLGDQTQVIAPPMIFTPDAESSLDPFALFLVYDPLGADCVGVSYIVRLNFDPNNFSSFSSAVYEAGEGMAGGFALAGENVLVSQSGIGEDQEARLLVVPDLTIPVGGSSADVSWWIELQ